ncbi:hypothetical protein [Pikeienuella sp. HZG-20]|uniref:hypothetical protein n=1 Tax=Paludibacillus litoralis TaxID=3133267 RepID=UPI0030EE5A6A
MGNRGGRIHREWRITRHHASARWIICRLAFKNRRRTVMSADSYTELFFLDEATAFAAGHRPCFECRREAAQAFAAAFAESRGAAPMKADEIDAILKAERRARRPLIRRAALAPGAMVAAAGAAFLYDGADFHRWSFKGYAPGAPEGPLTLLTPVSALGAFRAGYRPEMRI